MFSRDLVLIEFQNTYKKHLLSIALLIFYININAQVEFFVSPQGNDNNPGTSNQPFATLSAARNAIRGYKKDN